MRKILSIAVGLVLVSSQVYAQGGDSLAQAKEHYKLGQDAYQAGKYDLAIKELKQAYGLKALPPLLLNIGATYRKLGDNAQALEYYQKYLTDAPNAKDRAEVEKIVAEIDKKQTKADKIADAAPAKEDSHSWAHTTIDSAPPASPIDVRVTVPVLKGVKVYTYYRQPGEAEFRSVIMKRFGNDKIARIPGNAVSGTSLQYYIEAHDQNGHTVKNIGTPGDPNIVVVDASAKPVVFAAYEQSLVGGAAQLHEDRNAKEEVRPESRARKREAQLDDETPQTGRVDLTNDRPTKRNADSPHRVGPVFYAGLAIAAAGAGLAAVVAPIAFHRSSQFADAVGQDSRSGFNFNSNPDGATDKSFQDSGKTWNAAGIGTVAAGSILLVGGTAMMIYDGVFAHHSGGSDKAKPAKSGRHSDEDAHWYVAPSVAPTAVGVGGGFSF